MPQAPFDPEATTHRELMESRSSQFIKLDQRAAKGEPMTREERHLMAEYSKVARGVGPVAVDTEPY
jgi:hypothetical protein